MRIRSMLYILVANRHVRCAATLRYYLLSGSDPAPCPSGFLSDSFKLNEVASSDPVRISSEGDALPDSATWLFRERLPRTATIGR